MVYLSLRCAGFNCFDNNIVMNFVIIRAADNHNQNLIYLIFEKLDFLISISNSTNCHSYIEMLFDSDQSLFVGVFDMVLQYHVYPLQITKFRGEMWE